MNFQNEKDVKELFQVADSLAENTPLSFETLISQTSFHENSGIHESMFIIVMSVEDVK